MMVLLALFAWAVALLVDLRPVYRQARPLVRWVCAALLLLGLAVQSLFEFNIAVPSPAQPITELVSNVLNLK